MNAKLRTQAIAAHPRVAEAQQTLTQVTRDTTNCTRAIKRGD